MSKCFSLQVACCVINESSIIESWLCGTPSMLASSCRPREGLPLPQSAGHLMPLCAKRAWYEGGLLGSGSLAGTELGAGGLPSFSFAPLTLKGCRVGIQIPISAESKQQAKVKGQRVGKEAMQEMSPFCTGCQEYIQIPGRKRQGRTPWPTLAFIPTRSLGLLLPQNPPFYL